MHRRSRWNGSGRTGRLAVVATVAAALVPATVAGAAPVTSTARVPVVAGDVWGPAYPVHLDLLGDTGESAAPGSLAATVRDGTRLLHAVTVGAGTREGSSLLAYGRSTDDGRTWAGRVRLSPPSHRVLRGAVTATGSHVYAAWLRKLPDNGGTRVYLRSSASNGRASSWSRVRLLGRGTDSSVLTTMSLTATGSTVVVGTLSRGRVLLLTSRDRGRTWSSRTVGSTHQGSRGSGRGTVALASSGSLIAVTWTVWSGTGKQTRARISRDRGRHWSASHQVAPCCGTPSVAVSIDRVVVAVGVNKDDDSTAGSIQTWRPGGWEPRRVLPLATGGDSINPMVVTHGTRTVGMTYAVGVPTPGQSMVLRWQESGDDGLTWTEPVDLYPPTGSYSVPTAYPSSVVWRAQGPLHVLYSAVDVDHRSSTSIVTRT